jgi:hypothetical protein
MHLKWINYEKMLPENNFKLQFEKAKTVSVSIYSF